MIYYPAFCVCSLFIVFVVFAFGCPSENEVRSCYWNDCGCFVSSLILLLHFVCKGHDLFLFVLVFVVLL